MWLVWIASAFAVSGVFAPEGDSASSPGGDVLVRRDGASLEITWSPRVDSTTTEIGWLIGYVGTFESLGDADPTVFDTLAEQTTPVRRDVNADRRCGCDVAPDEDATEGEVPLDVSTAAEPFVGTYTHDQIEGGSYPDLLAWLQGEGFDVGTQSNALSWYVNNSDADFVAIHATAAAPTGVTPGHLPPVTLRVTADEVLLPFVFARYSLADDLRLTVYTLGEDRAVVSGAFTSEDLGSILGNADDDPRAVWESAVRDLTEQRSKIAVTWAGQTDDGFLTRLDVLARREVLEDDATLTFGGGTEATQSTVDVQGIARSSIPLGLVGFAICLGVALLRIPSKRHRE